MRTVDFVLYFLAVVTFAAAAAGATLGRVNLVALGLVFAFLVPMLAAFGTLR